MRYGIVVSAFVGVFLCSCAKNATVVSQERVSHGDELLDKYASNHSYAKGSGGVRSQSDQQSAFAGKQFHGSNDFSGKDYAKKGYTNKRWGGNTGYAHKHFNGDMDASRYKKSPEFVQQQARYNKMKANAQGQGYKTDGYSTAAAREASNANVATKNSNYAKRNTLERDPVIMTRQERAQLSVDETNSALGRKGGQ